MRRFSEYGLNVISTLNKREQKIIFDMVENDTIDTGDYRVSKNRVIEFYTDNDDNMIDVNIFNSVSSYLELYGRDIKDTPKKL